MRLKEQVGLDLLQLGERIEVQLVALRRGRTRTRTGSFDGGGSLAC